MLKFIKDNRDNVMLYLMGATAMLFFWNAAQMHRLVRCVKKDANDFHKITTNLKALTSSGKTVVFTNAKLIEQAEGKQFRGHYGA